MHLSPAQRLMGRCCKTVMPCKSTLLQPRHSTKQDNMDKIGRKAKQAFYYNRGSRPLDSISAVDAIRMRLPGRQEWSPGVCLKEFSPRSYLVDVGGRTYQRNHRQLLRMRETGDEENRLFGSKEREDNVELMLPEIKQSPSNIMLGPQNEPHVEKQFNQQQTDVVVGSPVQLRRNAIQVSLR